MIQPTKQNFRIREVMKILLGSKAEKVEAVRALFLECYFDRIVSK